MHLISKKALREFWRRHPESEPSLSRWFKIVDSSNFETLDELRATFPSADRVGSLVVFNVGGNNYRVVTSVHFNRGKIYIRHVLTHREYDRGRWKE
jgi:mRNA interferase HigB